MTVTGEGGAKPTGSSSTAAMEAAPDFGGGNPPVPVYAPPPLRTRVTADTAFHRRRPASSLPFPRLRLPRAAARAVERASSSASAQSACSSSPPWPSSRQNHSSPNRISRSRILSTPHPARVRRSSRPSSTPATPQRLYPPTPLRGHPIRLRRRPPENRPENPLRRRRDRRRAERLRERLREQRLEQRRQRRRHPQVGQPATHASRQRTQETQRPRRRTSTSAPTRTRRRVSQRGESRRSDHGCEPRQEWQLPGQPGASSPLRKRWARRARSSTPPSPTRAASSPPHRLPPRTPGERLS